MKIYEDKNKIIDVETSKNWVFRITNNTIMEFYRKKGKEIPSEYR